jgi:AraC-like DNA-binding protein
MLQADPVLQKNADKLNLSGVLNDNYVNGEIFNRVFETLHAQGVDSWVTRYADQLEVANHGPVSFAALSAAKLESAINTMVEFSCIRSTGSKIEVRRTNNRLEFVVIDLTGHPQVGRWLIEIGFFVMQRMIETIIAHPVGNHARLSFSHPRPKSFEAINKLFDIQARYNADQNVYSIPLSWTEISSPLSDPDTHRRNLAKCRELRLELEASRDDPVRIVTTKLLNHFDQRVTEKTQIGAVPSLQSLAEQMYMSPRTLIRKLAAQDASYRKILEQVRQSQAKQLLSNTHLTANEISEMLDYQEPANFTRAFKRWFSQTPTAWRRNQ